MMVVQQYSSIPFEIFTIDDLYTDDEIEIFLQFVKNADESNRKFTNSPFKNGKVIHEHFSTLMFERIRKHLPEVYTDRQSLQQGRQWEFVRVPKYVMYASICSGKMFGIHTDTGCEYNNRTREYSKFTVLTYLNDDYEGGHTSFYDDDFNLTTSITPRKNRTLVFDMDLFHKGNVVESGEKHWIGTELVCRLL